MQTFLPYPDFVRSALVLDYRRLGKQRVEAWQIYQALTRPDYGWQNHPAVRMWRGHKRLLCHYGHAMCLEWRNRGYVDNMAQRFADHMSPLDGTVPLHPSWYGSEPFHSSHRAALLYKDPEHYGQFGWTEEPKLDYIWPSAA